MVRLSTELAMGRLRQLLALKTPKVFVDLAFEQREILAGFSEGEHRKREDQPTDLGHIKIPIQFDVFRLVEERLALSAYRKAPHLNTAGHNNIWADRATIFWSISLRLPAVK
jgi:hypothetical protein